MKIIAATDYCSMSRKAANIISAQVILYPDSILGLATGSTPLGVYQQLVEWYKKGDIDFSRIKTFNLDEYCSLSPEHEQSYYYYMNANFFNQINIRRKNIHIPDGTAENLERECKRYDNLIVELGGIDLQLLGIGHTGHIGFNEPDQAFDKMTHRVELSQQTLEANARFFGSINEVPRFALTLGIKAIMQSKKILLVVSGGDKADILYQSLYGPITPSVPASIIQLHPNLTVIADQASLCTISRLVYPSLRGESDAYR
jgi:glucosamine-6-phosphate deaminase